MDVILISEDYFLAQGLISLMPDFQWCRSRCDSFISARPQRRGVIFIDDRLNPLDIYHALPRARLNDYVVILQIVADVTHHHFFPYCQSVIEMSLKPDKLMQRLSQCLRSARDNMARRKFRALLTPKEELVISYFITGLSVADVAKKTGLSPKSVYGHRLRVVSKMGFPSYAHFCHAVCLTAGGDSAGLTGQA